MKMPPTFIPNESQNILSPILDDFFNRQLYLDATATVILHLDNKANLSFLHIFSDINNKNTFHNSEFHTFPENTREHQKLINFIHLNLIAQSVENFETLLKKIIKSLRILNPNIPEEKLNDNKKRIKFIKTHSNDVANMFQVKKYAEIYDLFLTVEKVRHTVVHSKSVIKLDSKLQYKSQPFLDYFRTETVNDELRILVNVGGVQQIIIKISEFSFMLFQVLSKEYSLPIAYIS